MVLFLKGQEELVAIFGNRFGKERGMKFGDFDGIEFIHDRMNSLGDLGW